MTDGAARVLCYSRPWSYARFRQLASLAFPGAAVRHIGDFPGHGTERMQERFDERLQGLEQVSAGEELGEELFADIRARCRLLRNIERDAAERMVVAMHRTVRELFDTAAPEVVLSSPVDSYVVDLLRLESARRGIAFLGLISVFTNGYFRLTARGERVVVRTVGDAECEKVLGHMLGREYEPEYLRRPVSATRAASKALAAQLRNIARWAYFASRRRISGERFCYHYWGSEVVARNNLNLLPVLPPGDPSWRRRLSGSGGHRVFLPLQYVPEATVDYWCENVEVIDYYDVLFRLVESAATAGIRLVVKEHPGVLGLRPACVYRELQRHEHVVLVPTQVHSNAVLEATDAVVVWTGTIGFEAALRGKSVLHLGNPFYASGPRMSYLHGVDDFTDSIKTILSATPGPIGYGEQIDMVRHVLEGCLPGNFPAFYDEELGADEQRQQLEQVASSLRSIGPSAVIRRIRRDGPMVAEPRE